MSVRMSPGVRGQHRVQAVGCPWAPLPPPWPLSGRVKLSQEGEHRTPWEEDLFVRCQLVLVTLRQGPSGCLSILPERVYLDPPLSFVS